MKVAEAVGRYLDNASTKLETLFKKVLQENPGPGGPGLRLNVRDRLKQVLATNWSFFDGLQAPESLALWRLAQAILRLESVWIESSTLSRQPTIAPLLQSVESVEGTQTLRTLARASALLMRLHLVALVEGKNKTGTPVFYVVKYLLENGEPGYDARLNLLTEFEISIRANRTFDAENIRNHQPANAVGMPPPSSLPFKPPLQVLPSSPSSPPSGFRLTLPAEFEPPECVPAGGCNLLPQVPAGAVRLTKGRLDAFTALELKGSDRVPSGSDCVPSPSISSDPGLTPNSLQGTQQVVYATQWTTQEFLEKALQAVHPCDLLSGCEPDALENIRWIASTPAADVCAFRTNALKALLQSEAELRREEDLLHKSLHPEVACVLKGKRLLLFRKLAQAAGIEDSNLFQEVCDGFRILGYAKPSGQFPVAVKPASMGEHELQDASRWIRGMLRKPGHAESEEVALELWNEAVQQSRDGSG